MKKALALLPFLLLLITSCSNNEPAIVKVDTPLDETTEEPELVEEVMEDEVIDEYIEFTLDEEVIRVNLKQIPILKAYLQSITQPNSVIEKMQIQKLFEQEDNEIYLLSFSCSEGKCSYLVLDQISENKGFLVADLATFEDYIISPEENKLLLKFNRPSTQELPLSNIVIIDMNKWEILSLESDAIVNNMFDFNWPILSANWVDEETVSISVPDSLPINREKVEDNQENNELLFHVY